MLKLKAELNRLCITQSELAAVCDVSPASMAQLLNHGIWPRRLKLATRLRARILAWCADYDVKASDLLFEKIKPRCASTETYDNPLSEEDENMLLRRQTLTPEAKKQFGVLADPFGDLRCTDDMWLSQDIRYIREHMVHTAKNGGFLAIIGESGAGKSTLRRDLEQRIEIESLPVVLIQPYVLAAEDNDNKGKTLKASDIADAIFNAVAPHKSRPQSAQNRFDALHKALKESSESGYRHCILIEEAHSLPLPTLKHLKRFLELEVGFTKLVSVILVGQPELHSKLSQRSAGVREVVQRCEITKLQPIAVSDIHGFIAHRLSRADKKIASVIDESGVTELVNRLTDSNGNTHLFPLAVGNFIVAAMNLAAEIGAPIIDADVIREVA